MFEKFLSANAADFRQRYEGTFGFFRKEDGNKLLVQLQTVNANKCVFVDESKQEYSLYPDSDKGIGFEFIPPKASYYNDDTQALLVQRVVQRQFQRGISRGNTSIYNMRANGVYGNLPIDFVNLQSIFVKAKPFKSALDDIENRVSVAISNQLALSTKPQYVFLFDKRIGTYKRTDRHYTFKLDEPDLWRIEIMDAFKLLDCTVEVS